MNALTRDLADLTRVAESQTDGKDRFRQKLHLMPPTVLCQLLSDHPGSRLLWLHLPPYPLLSHRYKQYVRTFLFRSVLPVLLQPHNHHGKYS